LILQNQSYFLKNKVPSYFKVKSIILLCFITYLNTKISFESIDLYFQILLTIPLILIWIYFVGLKLDSLIFATFCLLPSTAILGIGYFLFPGAALSLSDIFAFVVIIIYILKPIKLYLSIFILYLWLLLLVCLLSIIFAADTPYNHIGQFLRLLSSIMLITIILGSKLEYLRKPVLCAMLTWPLITIFYLFGIDGLFRFITFGSGAVFNNSESGEVLYGSHVFVMYILPLFPLAIFFKCSRFILFLIFLYLSSIIFYSYSRSLLIGYFCAFSFHILYIISFNLKAKKIIFSLVIIFSSLIVINKLDYFNFNLVDNSKSLSTYVRIAKMQAAWNTFNDNLFLGIGYGSVGAVDSKRDDFSSIGINDPIYLERAIDVKASSEFTPIQILAETGSLGGLISLILIIYSFKKFILTLVKNNNILHIYVLLCWLILFITSFIGGNSFSTLPLLLSIPFILDNIKLK